VCACHFFPCRQARLSELYQKGSDESEQRVQELLGAVERMQGLLDEVSKEKEELQTTLNETNITYVHGPVFTLNKREGGAREGAAIGGVQFVRVCAF